MIVSRFCVAALLLGGGLMAEHIPQKWVTITDKESGLEADFPYQPLEMAFDIPFQNTPPAGKIHLYSVPTPRGIFVASTFVSPTVNEQLLEKEALYQFLLNILVPHFFFNPSVFHDQQVYTYKPTEINGTKAASFQITYQDHGIVKKLEGIATIKNSILHLYFYLASKETFDQGIFERYLNSIK